MLDLGLYAEVIALVVKQQERYSASDHPELAREISRPDLHPPLIITFAMLWVAMCLFHSVCCATIYAGLFFCLFPPILGLGLTPALLACVPLT